MAPSRPLTGLLLFLVIAAFTYTYWSALQSMVSVWQQDLNYSHGFLVPLVSAYLVWDRRKELATAAAKPSTWGLVLLGFGLSLFLLGHVAGENFTKSLSMLPVLAGAVVFTAGSHFLRIVQFPLAYLLFMIPLPYLLYDAVAFPLKLFVSWISVLVLQWLGYSVLREGNLITLSATTLEVADACSGIRSIISLLALSAVLAYFSQKGWLRKATLVALAVPIAVVANSFRVIVTAMLADRYGVVVAQGFLHEFAGVAIFAIAIALLLLSSFALRELGPDE